MHHYPEIKELNCISEKDKIKLDEFLVGWGWNSYLYKYNYKLREMSKNWSNEIINEILEFLVSKKILKKYYKFYICCDYIIVNEEKINKYLRLFELSKIKELSDDEWKEYDKLQQELNYNCVYCPECDNEIEITEKMIMDTINKPDYLYKIIKERDKTYDNV